MKDEIELHVSYDVKILIFTSQQMKYVPFVLHHDFIDFKSDIEHEFNEVFLCK